MYEATEKKRNVLLYGVPGIPSLLLPNGSTFYDVRRILWVRAPHLPNFYFVLGGVIVKDEFVQIEWSTGQLVLHVQFCGELKGGSDTGSGGRDDRSKRIYRTSRRKRPLSDTSDEEVSDGSEPDLLSDIESTSGSDSSWDPEREKKRKKQMVQAARNKRKRRGGDRTDKDIAVQDERNLRKRKGGDRTDKDIAVQQARDKRKRKGADRTDKDIAVKNKSNLGRRKGADRTEKDKDVKKKANLRRPRKSVSELYDQYSRDPPTKAQCADSGYSVWNAVAAFYSSQPPPPERTMPYFESLFSRPFLFRLLIAAVEKLDPALSESDNNFEYVENMLHTVSLFNEFGDLVAICGNDDYDVGNPTPLTTLQQHAADLEPRTLVEDLVSTVRDLLQLLYEYRETYSNSSDSSATTRQELLEKMVSIIRNGEMSGAVTAEDFYTMYNNYVSLKERTCKICTVCGVRRPVDRLKDALAYFDLLKATSDQTDAFNSLVNDKIEEDRMGRLAQRCFHIENLNGQLYHFLDFDEEKYEENADTYEGLDPTQDPLFSLCSSGVPTKLPACDHCHTALKKRSE